MATPSNNGTRTMNVRLTRYSANSWGIELMSSIAASASIRSMPRIVAITTAPSKPTSDTPMNSRPMRL